MCCRRSSASRLDRKFSSGQCAVGIHVLAERFAARVIATVLPGNEELAGGRVVGDSPSLIADRCSPLSIILLDPSVNASRRPFSLQTQTPRQVLSLNGAFCHAPPPSQCVGWGPGRYRTRCVSGADCRASSASCQQRKVRGFCRLDHDRQRRDVVDFPRSVCSLSLAHRQMKRTGPHFANDRVEFLETSLMLARLR